MFLKKISNEKYFTNKKFYNKIFPVKHFQVFSWPKHLKMQTQISHYQPPQMQAQTTTKYTKSRLGRRKKKKKKIEKAITVAATKIQRWNTTIHITVTTTTHITVTTRREKNPRSMINENPPQSATINTETHPQRTTIELTNHQSPNTIPNYQTQNKTQPPKPKTKPTY